jgi:hypothetical protein
MQEEVLIEVAEDVEIHPGIIRRRKKMVPASQPTNANIPVKKSEPAPAPARKSISMVAAINALCGSPNREDEQLRKARAEPDDYTSGTCFGTSASKKMHRPKKIRTKCRRCR